MALEVHEGNLGVVSYHKVVLEEATPENREQRQQSQVKKRKTAANVKALREGLTQRKDCIQQNSQPWVAPTGKQQRQESSAHVKGSNV